MAVKVDHSVPFTPAERHRLRELLDALTTDQGYTPPLSMANLSVLADQLITDHQLDDSLKGWIMVEANNSVWKETIAAIPHPKRMLLLPQCLSNSVACKAQKDAFGLLCYKCNHCTIPGLQDLADELGLMSLVAEGFTTVVGLVESGAVDGVIGVGCLDSLEKAFPLLIRNAVPGLAVPLNNSGCKDTHVDIEYVEGLMRMQTPQKTHLVDYKTIKSTLKTWFEPSQLTIFLGTVQGQTPTIAREWLAGEGKRWRPFLVVATYQALTGQSTIPDHVKAAAIAVECFHKASLVHDDIQDNDALRYGKETVNSAHGIPTAINVGDYLLGEGYRTVARCNNIELIHVAAAAHLALCNGQGMELEWSQLPHEITMEQVLDIFCQKTVPAFEVALEFGALCAHSDEALRVVLRAYSKALGIAYQLKDDMEDFESEAPLVLRPSAVLAALCEDNPDKGYSQLLANSENILPFLKSADNKNPLRNALARVKTLQETHQQAAMTSLDALGNIELKRLLYRVTARILD